MCNQGVVRDAVPLKGSREESFFASSQLLLAPSNPGLGLITPITASIFTEPFSLSLCVLSSSKDISRWT